MQREQAVDSFFVQYSTLWSAQKLFLKRQTSDSQPGVREKVAGGPRVH